MRPRRLVRGQPERPKGLCASPAERSLHGNTDPTAARDRVLTRSSLQRERSKTGDLLDSASGEMLAKETNPARALDTIGKRGARVSTTNTAPGGELTISTGDKAPAVGGGPRGQAGKTAPKPRERFFNS